MKKILTLLLIACFTKQVNAQIITTVAGNIGGNGGANYANGDGGQATNASLGYPFAGTFDAMGNMYIVDVADFVIRKVNTAGIISTIAGNYTGGYYGDGGPATAAALNEPLCIAAFGQNLYISDDQNHAIRKIDRFGVITTIAGTGFAGFSGDGGPATAAQLNSQNSIAFDALGNLFIADGSNNRIRMINTSGIITTVVGNGYPSYTGDGGQATAASIHNPTGIATDTFGNLYMVDATNYVRKINTAGIITTIAGTGSAGFTGDGGQATAAQVNFPNGLAADNNGNLYIADWQNNRIRKINTAGIIMTIAGTGVIGFSGDGGQANAAQIYMPGSVFFDANGSLYIADDYNGRIRKVTNAIPDTNQVGIQYILSPILGCNNSTINPVVRMANFGTNTITTCLINYQIDNSAVQTYTWSGSLAPGLNTNINLSSYLLNTVGSHTLICYCTNPNNGPTNFQALPQSRNFFNSTPGTLPIIEGFETTTTLPNTTWDVSHTSTTGGTDFTSTTLAAATGSKSCMLDNINNTAGNNSIIQTIAAYDLTTFTTPALTFKAAYQQKATTNADKLQIFTSTNCGAVWAPRKTITATALASLAGGTGTSPYVPTPAQFTTYTVPISAVASSSNVIFRWEFLADPNGPGNNLYIDDINIIDNITGIQTLESNTDINIYPNPAQNIFTIETSSNEKQNVSVFDVNGKLILSQTIQGTTNIDASNFSAGVYNINIANNKSIENKKLIIIK